MNYAPAVRSLSALTVAITVLLGSFYVPTSFGQVIYQNNFDQYTTARTYDDNDLDSDWNTPSFNNGVTEGRVSIVTGAAAYGGTGSAIAVNFPFDKHGPTDTGAQWKFDFDEAYEEVYLRYRVRFETGFDFVRGGKLPGLAGGTSPTGSTQADGFNGWTGRMMWRTDFDGVSGQPEQHTATGISYAKYTDSGFAQDGRNEDKEFWFDSNENPVVIQSDQWYQVTQRIKMNTAGQSNGILQIWLDDELVHDQQDVLFRLTDELKIDQMYFSTFFGGNDDWKTSKDETVYFDEVEIYRPEPRFLKVPQHYPTIQEALDIASPGDTVAIRGVHRTNIVLDKDIFFRGYNGTIIIAVDTSQPVIRVTTSNAHLKRFDLRNGTHGILVESGNQNVTVDYMTVRNPTSTAIELQSNCHGAAITKNLTLWSNDGDGILVTDSDNVTIEDNRVYYGNGNGIVVSGGSNVTIEDNKTVGHETGFNIIGSNHTLIDNYAGNSSGAGYLISGDNHYLFDNLARYNGSHGFSLVDSSNNLMLKNLALSCEGNGFDFRLMSDNNMVDLSGARFTANGFFLDQSSGNELTKNWSYVNENGYVLSSSTSGNTIQQSRATDNTNYGFLDEGSSNTLSQNYSRRNGGRPIVLVPKCTLTSTAQIATSSHTFFTNSDFRLIWPTPGILQSMS